MSAPSRVVYLGLGSNLGDRVAHLVRAVEGLRALDSELVVSRVYETAPVGGPTKQGPYLNCVVAITTDRTPGEILEFAHRLEAEARRVRAERFGPRTLDVDVLIVEGFISDDPSLTVPHPRLFERAFVLAPLEELDAALVPPHWRTRFGGEAAVDGAVTPLGRLADLLGTTT